MMFILDVPLQSRLNLGLSLGNTDGRQLCGVLLELGEGKTLLFNLEQAADSGTPTLPPLDKL